MNKLMFPFINYYKKLCKYQFLLLIDYYAMIINLAKI